MPTRDGLNDCEHMLRTTTLDSFWARAPALLKIILIFLIGLFDNGSSLFIQKRVGYNLKSFSFICLLSSLKCIVTEWALYFSAMIAARNGLG